MVTISRSYFQLSRHLLTGWRLQCPKFGHVLPFQKSRLRLSLNMQFHEFHDLKGLAKDVTSLGRWGNDDVEVVFSKLEELPYVMGLIRQALEKQMGNEDAQT